MLVAVPVQGYAVEVVTEARKPRWRRVGPEWKSRERKGGEDGERPW